MLRQEPDNREDLDKRQEDMLKELVMLGQVSILQVFGIAIGSAQGSAVIDGATVIPLLLILMVAPENLGNGM